MAISHAREPVLYVNEDRESESGGQQENSKVGEARARGKGVEAKRPCISGRQLSRVKWSASRGHRRRQHRDLAATCPPKGSLGRGV